MKLQAFIAASQRIAKVRQEISASLADDSGRLANAALRPFLDWLRQHPTATVNDFTELFQRDFHLTVMQKEELSKHLTQGQSYIARMRSLLYEEVGAISQQVDPTVLQSVYKVEFGKIDTDVRNVVLQKLRKLVANNGSLETFAAELRQSKLVDYQSRTLSQTALAQFDNAYTFEIAREAGIDEFKYIGPPAMRPFCQKLLSTERTYTLAEIQSMNNGQGLDVFTSGGGYNCQHQWLAIPEQLEK